MSYKIVIYIHITDYIIFILLLYAYLFVCVYTLFANN